MAALDGPRSAEQTILDDLISGRRRMLAGETLDRELLEANRRAIAYWAARLTGGSTRRSAAEGRLRKPNAFGPVGQRTGRGTGTESAR